jgi:tetrahydromethanopterin S-methyltransferase subunit H
LTDNNKTTVQIGGVTLGGRPGEHPTVMVGSIFNAGQKIVRDEKNGDFDKDKAKELIEQQDELSQRVGLPCILDVIGSTEKAMITHLEFCAKISDAPMLVDSMSPAARMAAIKHFSNSEVMDRLIYNSIDEHFTEEELEAIAGSGIKNAVVLAFSNKAVKPKAKIKLLQDKLLPAAEKAGVENILLDPGVLDLASTGWTGAAIEQLKDVYKSYPVGCAPANAIYTWKNSKGLASPSFQAVAGGVFSYLIAKGTDFIFYGPIGIAPWAFPACAVSEAVCSYEKRLKGTRPKTPENPLNKYI